jgi:hypothetical protein
LGTLLTFVFVLDNVSVGPSSDGKCESPTKPQQRPARVSFAKPTTRSHRLHVLHPAHVHQLHVQRARLSCPSARPLGQYGRYAKLHRQHAIRGRPGCGGRHSRQHLFEECVSLSWSTMAADGKTERTGFSSAATQSTRTRPARPRRDRSHPSSVSSRSPTVPRRLRSFTPFGININP